MNLYNQRKKDLENHISKELDLQKQLEDKLRYENDLKEQKNLESQIDQSINKRKTYKQELDNLGLEEAMTKITFRELETVTQGILCMSLLSEINYQIIPPKEKMLKNELTSSVQHRLMTGIIQAKNVHRFIENFVIINPDFPEKLKAGFITEYNNLRRKGFKGDQLFNSLHHFSSGFKQDFDLQAAGLAVLYYLFERCEIFEK